MRITPVHDCTSQQLSRSSESVRSHQSSSTRHTTIQQHTTAYERPKDAEQHVYSPSTSRTLRSALSESVHAVRRDVGGSSPPPPEHKKPKRSDTAQPNTATSDITSSSQTAELSKRYEALLRDHESVRGELQAKLQNLKENDHLIRSLKADNAALQRSYEEQSAALRSARHDLRSCQSQLDNVQSFISTADPHADQDITQMLRELNEEVYQMSMTMADNVAEGFARQRVTARQPKGHTSVGETILVTIGQVMVNYLAAVQDEDIALFLQIAFQGFLSHFLRHIVSSWTVDRGYDALIEETYQRLRKAGEIIRCSIHVDHLEKNGNRNTSHIRTLALSYTNPYPAHSCQRSEGSDQLYHLRAL